VKRALLALAAFALTTTAAPAHAAASAAQATAQSAAGAAAPQSAQPPPSAAPAKPPAKPIVATPATDKGGAGLKPAVQPTPSHPAPKTPKSTGGETPAAHQTPAHRPQHGNQAKSGAAATRVQSSDLGADASAAESASSAQSSTQTEAESSATLTSGNIPATQPGDSPYSQTGVSDSLIVTLALLALVALAGGYFIMTHAQRLRFIGDGQASLAEDNQRLRSELAVLKQKLEQIVRVLPPGSAAMLDAPARESVHNAGPPNALDGGPGLLPKDWNDESLLASNARDLPPRVREGEERSGSWSGAADREDRGMAVDYPTPEPIVRRDVEEGQILAAYNRIAHNPNPQELERFAADFGARSTDPTTGAVCGSDTPTALWYVPMTTGEGERGLILPGHRITRTWTKFYTNTAGIKAKQELGLYYEIEPGPELAIVSPAEYELQSSGYVLTRRGRLRGV